MNERAIILIEDNPDDRELTLRALRRCRPNQTVLVMEDGAEAFTFLTNTKSGSATDQRVRPALILLDLKMPKVDGLELLKRLRSEPNTRLVPIVVLTSSNERRDVQSAYQSGANSYLTKPVEFERFVGVVDCLCHYWLDYNEPLY